MIDLTLYADENATRYRHRISTRTGEETIVTTGSELSFKDLADLQGWGFEDISWLGCIGAVSETVRHNILCGCGWGMLGALDSDLEGLERTGRPVCGRGFTVEEGWEEA